MSILGSNMLTGAAGRTRYEIERSVRFNDGDNAYLRKNTFGTPDSTKIFTFSAWIKKGQLGDWFPIAGSHSGTAAFTVFGLDASDRLIWRIRNSSGSDITRLESAARLRDPSAWYHLLLQRDSTDSTAADRAKLYINGVRVTDFDQENTDELDRTYSSDFLQDINIGRVQINTSNLKYADGYIAEYYYIDGTALDPSSFTETDPMTGQLVPKRYVGSFGTNGFYLKFSDNSDVTPTTLGKDSSGNGNNFTPNNLSVTAGADNDSLLDTPTNNWCTLNPLNTDNVSTFSNGNLDTVCNNASTSGGSIAVNSGKWYAEVVCTAKTATNAMVGICTIRGFDGERQVDESQRGGSGHGYVMNGTKLSGGASYGATWAVNDVIGIALDLDSAQNTVTFYKNGASQGAINIDNEEYVFACSNGQSSSTVTYAYNFGQRAFAYTPPVGYLALNTKNLSLPTVRDGTKHFNTVLFTGNGSTQSVTGVGFQPDWTWIKMRSDGSRGHAVFDSVRGGSERLDRSATQEGRTNEGNISFQADGFNVTSSHPTVNDSSDTAVAWNWLAGGTASSNSDGSITSSVSVNPEAGFSIVTYTGPGSTETVGHGLGVAPKMIIIKGRKNTDHWFMYNANLNNPTTEYMYWNLGNAANSGANPWNGTAPTSSVFTIVNDGGVGSAYNGNTYVAYCFAEVEGYSKFGKYKGNSGQPDGTFVYTGFKPAFVELKRFDAGDFWLIMDNKRSPHNPRDNFIKGDSDTSEGDYNLTQGIDIYSNGFKLKDNDSAANGNNDDYIYMAFAEVPFKYANAC
tara:strand:+ start:9329 stop:11713 length:2385 start_codon:yes stop_codon:yes gene_type:complete